MQENDIRKYARLMKELELSGLEITDESGKIRLERAVAAPAVESVVVPVAPKPEEESGADCVKSPLVGVFYAAPAENAPPYVSVGDSIRKGQVLCIVEAMKLMNEITAEEDGTLTEICVTNGQIVEYGTVLFRIAR